MVNAEVVGDMTLEEPENVTFSAFVAQHHAGLLRFACLLAAGDQACAEDVVQTVFVRLFDQDRWRSVRSPQTYLRRAVVNEWRTQLRHRRHVVPTGHLPDLSASTDVSADVSARDWVWSALQQLSDRQRAAVVARYYLDLDDRETADLLGCTRATVRSLIHRALPQVAYALGETDPRTHETQEDRRG